MNIDKYFAQSLSNEDMLKLDPIVIPDANFLLAAYQWRSVTMKEVKNSLEKFHKAGRLKIPLHVIIEFTQNRPTIIQGKMNEIEMEINKLTTIKKLESIVPILENSSPYSDTEKTRLKHEKSVKDLRKNLQSIKTELSKLFSSDPFFDFIKKISADCVYISEDKIDIKQIKKTAKERFEKKIPPGYKDGEKENGNAEGDYIIWHDILSLKENVIFVSGDKKGDWVYTDKKGENSKILSSKIELLMEYAEKTEGKNFLHMSPKDFITFLNPTVDLEIQDDLEHNFSTAQNKNDLKSEMTKYLKTVYRSNDAFNKLKLLNSKNINIPLGQRKYTYIIYSSNLISEFQKMELRTIFHDLYTEIEFINEITDDNLVFINTLVVSGSLNKIDETLVLEIVSKVLGQSFISIEFS